MVGTIEVNNGEILCFAESIKQRLSASLAMEQNLSRCSHGLIFYNQLRVSTFPQIWVQETTDWRIENLMVQLLRLLTTDQTFLA